MRTRSATAITLLFLALLCVLAYAPSLSIPLIEDDYPNITQAQVYGLLSGLPALFHDGVFRLRATNYWVTLLIWQTFHLKPAAWHLTSLALHVANSWLVFILARTILRMRLAATCAAAFFAVHEGHQEAVMWFSAINELLMFFFGIGAMLCWLRSGSRGGSRTLTLSGLILFSLALLSKESAVILMPLFLLTALAASPRPSVKSLLPYCLLASLALASIAASRNTSFRFSDGSFSLHAPFWITWPRGILRLLWFWGWLSVGLVMFVKGPHLKRPHLKRPALLALAWMGIAFLPYSFLTYSTQIPSRQTYLASVGLSLLFGMGVSRLSLNVSAGRRLVTAVTMLMVMHNVGFLWIRKRAQFLRRAEPTQQLIEMTRHTAGPIWVRCFPRSPLGAAEAVRIAAGWQPSRLIWSESEASQRKPAAVFCYKER